MTKGLLRGQAHSLAGRLDVALDTLNEVLEHQPQCARGEPAGKPHLRACGTPLSLTPLLPSWPALFQPHTA